MTSLSHRSCLFFPTRRLEGWCWSQHLQVILLVQVQDKSDSGEDGDATQVADHEVAPVDATAVELPSHTSVVDALEFDL